MIEKLAEYNRIEKTQAHSLITTSAPMIHSQIKNLADDEYVLSFLSPNGTLKLDILPDLKDGDSSCETLMSERKNIQCGIYIPIMERTALHTLPFSYS